ncbi:MAG: molecular chaperone TorD family protein [Sulfolobales archaeon]|nr:molecular chaperone TorD family protein [Sulfolobales archaeon]
MIWEEFKLFSYLFLGVRYNEKVKELLDKVKDRRYYENVKKITEMIDSGNKDQLATEFTRCFINDYKHLKCPPYESWYRERTIYGKVVAELYGIYSKYGIQPVKELPDHISTEMEFLAYVLYLGKEDEGRRFLVEHIFKWVPQFVNDIEKYHYGEYTKLLGNSLKLFLEELSNELEPKN